MTDAAPGGPHGRPDQADTPVPDNASVPEPSAASPVPRWAIIGIFLMLFVAGIAYAREFLIPVVLAFLLALVFSPVRRFLERRARLPSGLAAFLIVGGLLATLVTIVALLAEPVQRMIEDAPRIGRQVERKLSGVAAPARAVVKVGEEVDKITSGAPAEGTAPSAEKKAVQEVVVRTPGFVSRVTTVAPTILAQAAFTLVLLFFVLASGDMIYEKVVNVLPTLRDKRLAMRIASDIELKLSRYFFTITLINAALGVAIGIAMWVLDMPTPLLFGVIAFVFNFVPYLGAVVGVVIAAVVGVVSFDSLGQALLPALVYFALTSLEGQLITPHLLGRRLEMNTVVVFGSVALWAWLWSVMGMLVAVPLLVTIRAFCEHIPQLEPVGKFLSARGRELVNPQAANGAESPPLPDRPVHGD
jgi:predicted PurR-regulated permease PerM